MMNFPLHPWLNFRFCDDWGSVRLFVRSFVEKWFHRKGHDCTMGSIKINCGFSPAIVAHFAMLRNEYNSLILKIMKIS